MFHLTSYFLQCGFQLVLVVHIHGQENTQMPKGLPRRVICELFTLYSDTTELCAEQLLIKWPIGLGVVSVPL